MNKIMIIMPELFHGGAEKQFRAIITGIDKQQYKVIVVNEHAYGNENIELINEFIRYNKDIRYLELKKRNCKRVLKYILINKDMIKIILKYKPDLVFSASLKLVFLCKFLRIPFVYSERNSAEGEKYYKEKTKALKLSTQVTCNSIVAQKELNAHGIKACYIANGIEECEMLDKELESSLIITPARISMEKNQEVIIDALKLLPEKLKLALVGKVSEKEYMDVLAKKINKLGLQERVKFISFTNDIKSLYQKSAVIVLPSITEGLSNVILESYMFGRICVLSDIPQNRIVGSEGQRYFNPHSAKNLAEKIKEVLRLQLTEYEEECQKNHIYVMNNFCMTRMVEKYQEIFNSIISSGKKQRGID